MTRDHITDAEIDAAFLLGVVPEKLAFLALTELRRRRALEQKWRGDEQVKRLLSPQRLDPIGNRQTTESPNGSLVHVRDYEEAVAELLPYRNELLKIADQVGEGNDPFAAWESIRP